MANVDTLPDYCYFSHMSSPVSYDLQGQGGGIVLSTNDTATGPFRWLQAVNDTVLNDLTSSNITNANTYLVGPTIPAGLGIGGRFEYIDVTSGVIIAYYA